MLECKNCGDDFRAHLSTASSPDFCSEECEDDYYDNMDDGYYPPEDDNLSDVEADADTLASAGYGTDEDYNDY